MARFNRPLTQDEFKEAIEVERNRFEYQSFLGSFYYVLKMLIGLPDDSMFGDLESA